MGSQAPALRFRFELTPLDEVPGWGHAHDELHWFGLSDGRYWIEVGQRVQPPGEMDYYVARLWEDALGLASWVLQPVPADLVVLLASDPKSWLDPFDDDVDAAVTWHGNHLLDFGYVRDAPRVMAWRTASADVDDVTVLWSRREGSPVQGIPGEQLQVVMPTDAFRRAIEDFDSDFMQAMSERIRDVQEGRLPAGISIALGRLANDHDRRRQSLVQVLSQPRETDWDSVREGARKLLGWPPEGR